MSGISDRELRESIASDAFHVGLGEHGDFAGFPFDQRRDPVVPGSEIHEMSETEIEQARRKMSRDPWDELFEQAEVIKAGHFARPDPWDELFEAIP